MTCSVSKCTLLHPFAFHDLPEWVRFKILKQYVPALCKTSVLTYLPEFSELLDCHQSWLTGAFYEFSGLLRSIKRGVYWGLESGSNLGYHVSQDSEKLTFRMCCIHTAPPRILSHNSNLNTFNLYKHFYPKPYLNQRSIKFSNVCISLETMQNFLATFFNKYTRSMTKMIKIYRYNKYNYFFVNRLTNVICWENGELFKIRDNECIVMERDIYIYLRDKETIELSYKNLYYRSLKPISLKSYLLEHRELQQNLCELEFRIINEEHVLLDLDIGIYTQFKWYWKLIETTRDELNYLFKPPEIQPDLQF